MFDKHTATRLENRSLSGYCDTPKKKENSFICYHNFRDSYKPFEDSQLFENGHIPRFSKTETVNSLTLLLLNV